MIVAGKAVAVEDVNDKFLAGEAVAMEEVVTGELVTAGPLGVHRCHNSLQK